MRLLLCTIIVTLLSCSGLSQSPTTIKLRCPSPNGTVQGKVQIAASGNIIYAPCPTKSNIFSGIVDFSGATVIGGGITSLNGLTGATQTFATGTTGTNFTISSSGTAHTFNFPNASAANRGLLTSADWTTFNNKGVGTVLGSGTLEFVPRWNGTTSTLANTPLSWNGTVYNFENTGLNTDFPMILNPTSGSGIFTVGEVAVSNISLDQSGGNITLGAATLIDINSFGGAVSIGDIGNVATGTLLQLDDNTQSLVLTGGGLSTAQFRFDNVTSISQFGDLAGNSNSTKFLLNDSLKLVTIDGTSNEAQLSLDGSNGVSRIGDVANSGNGTNLTINDVTSRFDLNHTGLLGILGLASINNFGMQRTITAAGTTGARTINKPQGTVNFAAAASSIVVTNSVAVATSLIFCTVQSLDATAISCRVTDKGVGVFTIRIPAATAETSVAFFVFN